MALKGRRDEKSTNIQCFGNSVMTRGGIASFSTIGSGAPMDQSQQLVAYAASASGAYPAGMLLNDMVNYDQTKQHINWHKEEVQVGGKVTLGDRGWWVTNMIIGTPAVGDFATLGNSGNIRVTTYADYATRVWNAVANPVVGRFDSTLDEDGYAQVSVNIR